jgi:hypothetical protein
MTYTYAAYELILRLPFPCPVLPLMQENTSPDVIVKEGSVPYRLAAPVAEGKMWQAEPDRFLWRGGPRAGRFLVEGGQCITLERNPAAEDNILAFHFLASVMAALLRQRGLLVLHANAAVTPTGAVAISGESGVGKSTALAALLGRGCTMLADDITVLRLQSDGCVEALPGVPQLHLPEDSAFNLGQDIAELPRYRWRRMKAAVPIEIAPAPVTLRALYLLRTKPRDDLQVQALTGAEKFAALQECVYGPLLPQEHPRHFPLFAAVTDQVAVYRLDRPIARWSVGEIVEVLLNG